MYICIYVYMYTDIDIDIDMHPNVMRLKREPLPYDSRIGSIWRIRLDASTLMPERQLNIKLPAPDLNL